jgi:hypothetical protein
VKPSSRGYGSLKLQYDVAEMLKDRRAPHLHQSVIIYFISDLDPSGLDLQRAWEEAMNDFAVGVEVVRIGLGSDRQPLS